MASSRGKLEYKQEPKEVLELDSDSSSISRTLLISCHIITIYYFDKLYIPSKSPSFVHADYLKVIPRCQIKICML